MRKAALPSGDVAHATSVEDGNKAKVAGSWAAEQQRYWLQVDCRPCPFDASLHGKQMENTELTWVDVQAGIDAINSIIPPSCW